MNTRLALNQIAPRQDALITRDQALASGLSPFHVRRRIRSGECCTVRPGVYAVNGARRPGCRRSPPSPSARRCGSLTDGWNSLGAPRDTRRCHPRRHEPRPWVRLAGLQGHRSGALFTSDLTTRQRITVTTPARPLVDLSAHPPFHQLGRAAVDDALRRRILTLQALDRCVVRLTGAPGRRPAAVQELLAERVPGCDPGDGDLETRVRRVVVGAGFQPPVQQCRVKVGGRTFKIDLAYPARRLAIELDGWQFHRSRTAFDDDRSRANLLVANGRKLIRFTSRTRSSAACGRLITWARHSATD